MAIETLTLVAPEEADTDDEARPTTEGPQNDLEGGAPLDGIDTLSEGVATALSGILTAKGYEWALLRANGFSDAEIARSLGVSRVAVLDRKKTSMSRIASDERSPELLRSLCKGGRMPHPDPARNSAGEWQVGPRSPENDPERLTHLAMSMHDTEGMAAHLAGENTPGRLRRPMTAADRWAAKDSGSSSPRPEGWGAPVELLENAHAVSFKEVDDRVCREQNRRAGVGWMMPMRRLAYLRRAQT